MLVRYFINISIVFLTSVSSIFFLVTLYYLVVILLSFIMCKYAQNRNINIL